MHASRKGGKASLESVLEGDTLFLAADTLRQTRKVVQLDSITFDTLKVLTADNRVEIYKSDLQAVTDSLSLIKKIPYSPCSTALSLVRYNTINGRYSQNVHGS